MNISIKANQNKLDFYDAGEALQTRDDSHLPLRACIGNSLSIKAQSSVVVSCGYSVELDSKSVVGLVMPHNIGEGLVVTPGNYTTISDGDEGEITMVVTNISNETKQIAPRTDLGFIVFTPLMPISVTIGD